MSTQSDDPREILRAVGRRLDRLGLVGGSGGNVSARCGGDVLITPSGCWLGRVEARDLVAVPLEDAGEAAVARPSMELGLHVRTYRRRPDVRAVVHAHPPAVVALTLAGVSLVPVVLPETLLVVGQVEEVGLLPPGSQELAAAAGEALAAANAVVLERHGAVTVGDDPWHALDRLEALEHAARALLLARGLGAVPPLAGPELERLHEVARRLRKRTAPEGVS